MPRVSAPLVLLPAWLVMVACSPHSLRIGKCCSYGTLGAGPELAPVPFLPQVSTGDIWSCPVPSLGTAGLAVVVGAGGAGGEGALPPCENKDAASLLQSVTYSAGHRKVQLSGEGGGWEWPWGF